MDDYEPLYILIVILHSLLPLGLTTLMEYLIIKLFFRKTKVFLPVFSVNMLTHPLITYIHGLLDIFFNDSFLQIITIFLELLVTIVEAKVYTYLLDVKFKKSLIISFIANAVSYLFGGLLLEWILEVI